MISIAMTTYNGENYLREQLDSILNQTYSDFELIICDDFSKDNTRLILSEYAAKDSRIKIFFNEENLGFKKNFEKSISLCSGEYIAFSDQDDIWLNNKLEMSIKYIGNNYLLCTDAICVNEDGKSLKYTMKEVIHYKCKSTEIIQKHLVVSNFVQGATIFARADFIRNHLPIPNEFEYHDWYYGILAAVDNKLIYLDAITLKYRQHTSQVTINKKKNIVNNILDLKYVDFYRKNIQNIIRCEFISKSSIFPKHIQDFAQNCERYFKLLNTNKNMWTYRFYFKNYRYFNLDNNVLHKILEKHKRLLGVLKFQLKTKRISKNQKGIHS